MPVCQYFGQLNCTAPTFGGGSATGSTNDLFTTPTPSLFHQYFGTNLIEQALNAILYFLILRYIIWPFIIVPILDWLDWRRQPKVKAVLLELTPPSVSLKTPEATHELYRNLQNLCAIQPDSDRWSRRKQVISLETVSDRPNGIRFLARVPEHMKEAFKQAVVSYLPEIQFKPVEDYLSWAIVDSAARHQSKALREYKLARSFVYPLRSQESLASHDPAIIMTGAMAKPEAGETFVTQLLLYPYRSKRASKIRNKLASGKEPRLLELSTRSILSVLLQGVGLVLSVTFGIVDFVLSLFDHGPSFGHSRQTTGYSTNPTTQAIHDKMLAKLGEPLFRAEFRVFLIANDEKRLNTRFNSFDSSLASFTDLGFQELVPSESIVPSILAHLLKPIRRSAWGQSYNKFQMGKFRQRQTSLLVNNSNVLSVSEVAGLYHFPYGNSAAAVPENLVQSFSKTLPAPLSMKRHSDAGDYDVTLGLNKYHGSNTIIGLTAKEREKHVYLIGGTGNGKTTMLEYALLQDINAGKGIAFIDPHGDAAQKLLRYIPKKRINDVVYLNPKDIKYPVGLNLLELPKDLDEDELLVEQERVTEAVVSVLRKVFADDDANAHRIETMLRNTIRTAFTTEAPTLFACLELLRNSEYRNKVVVKLTDQHLKDFWREEFGKAGGMQRVSMSKGLTSRLDRFDSSQFVKRMMGQAKSTISFEDIIDSGKILICNFSTDMGEDTSTLFGTTVLAKLKIAAERRSSQLEAKRKPFYVYVDEFQNFATTPFVKMLSASRKYKLFLTIAEQSTAQQEEQRLTEAILANVSTIVCFGLGSKADEQLLVSRFEPWLETGNLLNQPAYSFYLRVKAVEPMEPVSGETIILPPEQASDDRAAAVITVSRQNYAIEWKKAGLKENISQSEQSSKEEVADQDYSEESGFNPQAEALDA